MNSKVTHKLSTVRGRKRRHIEISQGSSVIKVYTTRNGKYEQFTVAYHLHGKRKREKFASMKKVHEKADQIFTAIANEQTATLDITQDQRATLNRSLDLIAPTGKPLELVAAEYADAKAILAKAALDNVSLNEIATCYVRTHQARPEITVSDLTREMTAKKQAEHKSQRWIDDLESRLERFAEHFACPVSEISAQAIDRWLQTLKDTDGRPLGIRSRKNYRTAISTLFHFAKDRGYLPPDWSEIDRVGFNAAPDGKIQVWSPAELDSIIRKAASIPNEKETRLALWIALRAFAGIRFEEVSRMVGTDLLTKTKLIVLDSRITKTSTRRIIPMQPNLRTWIKSYDLDKGPIITRRSIGNYYADVLTALGLATRHNALRDSYTSYRMAQTGYDKVKVSQECGNSPSRLERCYRALQTNDGQVITPQLAAKYFSITPHAPAANVLRPSFKRAHP